MVPSATSGHEIKTRKYEKINVIFRKRVVRIMS